MLLCETWVDLLKACIPLEVQQYHLFGEDFWLSISLVRALRQRHCAAA